MGTFWPQFNNARSVCAERNRVEARGFNLLQILDVEDLERTHSRILANLLNPRGTHGQGMLFLRRFLDHIGLAPVKSKLTASGTEVACELSVTNESIPDIRISCLPWLILLIENKVKADEHRAPDGKWQLEKYQEWLDEPEQVAEVKRLFFLTIHGGPSKSGVEDRDISYVHDLRKWLERSLECVAAPAVQHILRRYLETIDNLRNL